MFIFKHMAKSFRNLISEIPDIKSDDNYRLLIKLTNKVILSQEESNDESSLITNDFIREGWLWVKIIRLYDTLCKDWDPDYKKRQRKLFFFFFFFLHLGVDESIEMCYT